MNTRLNKMTILSAVGLLAAGLMINGTTAQAQDAFDPNKNVAKPSSQVSYQNINPAIQMGAGFGNMGKGGHGTFGKFPPNFETPRHTHSHAYHGVVISGTMTNPFGKVGEEKNPPTMGPGSYWYVPAKALHSTACVSAEPCQFYFHSVGAFDFTEHKE